MCVSPLGPTLPCTADCTAWPDHAQPQQLPADPHHCACSLLETCTPATMLACSSSHGQTAPPEPAAAPGQPPASAAWARVVPLPPLPPPRRHGTCFSGRVARSQRRPLGFMKTITAVAPTSHIMCAHLCCVTDGKSCKLQVAQLTGRRCCRGLGPPPRRRHARPGHRHRHRGQVCRARLHGPACAAVSASTCCGPHPSR